MSAMQGKLDAALLMVPIDLVSVLVAYGADQAFIWSGVTPNARDEFFIHLGRMTAHLTEAAWEKYNQRDRST